MRYTAMCLIAAFALLVAPSPISANQPTSIWITNTTDNCLWATVYTANKIVNNGGFPNWVPAKGRRAYPITWKGVGQAFRVRAEVLSTRDCRPQSAAHPLVADVSTNVQGSIVYQVRLVGSGRHFTLERY